MIPAEPRREFGQRQSAANEIAMRRTLKAELPGLPSLKHDDQVDSVTQALSRIGQRRQNRVSFVAPIIVRRPHTHFGDMPPGYY
jgi:hypothetical protein